MQGSVCGDGTLARRDREGGGQHRPSLLANSRPLAHQAWMCLWAELGGSLKDAPKALVPCTFQLALRPNLFGPPEANCLFVAQENPPAVFVKKHAWRSGTLAQLAGCPLWEDCKTDFSWDRQLLLPRDSPRRPPGEGPISSWNQLSRPPVAKAASYAHSFPFVQEAAAMKRDEPGSKVSFNDFIEAGAALTSFMGTMPPWRFGKR